MDSGSFVDVPKDLLKEIKHLEQLFTIDTPKLKEITERFVHELEKGENSKREPIMSRVYLTNNQFQALASRVEAL